MRRRDRGLVDPLREGAGMEDLKSSLCLACGMCCDGNLFAFVAVTSDDAKVFKQAGVEVSDHSGRLRVPQRCGALDGCRCRVYEKRPFVCRKFDCLLVRALSDKELPLEDALGVVQEAKQQLSRLEALLPRAHAGEPAGPLRRAAALHQAGTVVSDEAKAAFDEAEEFLRRHFVPD